MKWPIKRSQSIAATPRAVDLSVAAWQTDVDGVATPAIEEKATFNLRNFEPFLSWWGTSSGVAPTVDTGLGHTTVAACCRVIAEDVAKIPLTLKSMQADGTSQVAIKHPLFPLLRNRPNSWMTAFEFREALTLHACLTGTGYALPLKANNGKMKELIPLMPQWVEVVRSDNFAQGAVYRVRDHNGRLIGNFLPGDLFRISGPSWDTIQGINAIKTFREAIGLSMAIETSQAGLHGNATRPSGILSTPNTIGKETLENLKAQWEAAHQGVKKNFGTAVLDNALEFKPITMTGVDSQLIETRKHQVEEICRAFKVFPQMVGHAENTPYNSAEAFFSAHFRQTIWPWLERWEQCIDRDLLDRTGPLFAKFDTRQFEKASTSDRANFYRTVVELGIYTRAEVRDLEGLPPIKGLDVPLTPLNMTGEKDGFLLEQIRRLSHET